MTSATVSSTTAPSTTAAESTYTQDRAAMMKTYSPSELVISHGEGVYLYDDQ